MKRLIRFDKKEMRVIRAASRILNAKVDDVRVGHVQIGTTKMLVVVRTKDLDDVPIIEAAYLMGETVRISELRNRLDTGATR